MSPMARRALISTTAALLLATTPAGAFADGAGDNQYQDPLTAPSTPKKAKKNASTAPAAAPTTAPAATVAPTSTSSNVSSTSAPAATSPAQQLPRTGAPAGLIGL